MRGERGRAVQMPVDNSLYSTRLGVDWLEEPLVFFLGGNGVPEDFTGCTITAGIYERGRLLLDLSSTTDRTAIVLPNTVNISVEKIDMDTVGVGVFDVSIALNTADARRLDLIDFVLKVFPE